MKTKHFIEIGLRIICVCLIGMMVTFIPENLRDFFGDVKLETSHPMGIDRWYDWGVRHYWYFYMMLCLFILSAIHFVGRLIKIISSYD
jgi:hypothetical protein